MTAQPHSPGPVAAAGLPPARVIGAHPAVRLWLTLQREAYDAAQNGFAARRGVARATCTEAGAELDWRDFDGHEYPLFGARKFGLHAPLPRLAGRWSFCTISLCLNRGYHDFGIRFAGPSGAALHHRPNGEQVRRLVLTARATARGMADQTGGPTGIGAPARVGKPGLALTVIDFDTGIVKGATYVDGIVLKGSFGLALGRLVREAEGEAVLSIGQSSPHRRFAGVCMDYAVIQGDIFAMDDLRRACEAYYLQNFTGIRD